ncbi:MAG: 3-deoxy-manno-octulosonate cytidylyltransferase [Saprospiraceae bacterium]|nr:3-deoxy-manno-octulosonate cytidylyltransferase [Saprospiraceae bacterium]
MKTTLGIIPARFGSTRLPGKPLIKVKGKTIIERVYERVARASALDRVVVATDDVRIYNHVKKFGGEAMMTRQDHRSGTMRCAEVVEQMPEVARVVNVQGDEPLIHPGEIDRLCGFMDASATRTIATMIKRIDNIDDLTDPSVAKVVCDRDHRALYFSRSAIPHVRNHHRDRWLDVTEFYKHIGLYAYTREVLLQLASYDQSRIEEAELLEQLNWLYHGHAIHALETEVESIGIDTPEDVSLLEHILNLAD